MILCFARGEFKFAKKAPNSLGPFVFATLKIAEICMESASEEKKRPKNEKLFFQYKMAGRQVISCSAFFANQGQRGLTGTYRSGHVFVSRCALFEKKKNFCSEMGFVSSPCWRGSAVKSSHGVPILYFQIWLVGKR